ncbi:MAG: MAPEG family protein [Pseudomonadota bacterium]
MANELIIVPMFAMFLVTVVVLTLLFRSRVASVAKGEIEPGYYKVYQGGREAERPAKLGRHFINIFEAPVLFYVVCLAALATENASPLFQSLAWAYVAVRVVHAYIHIGANKIMPRIRVYMVSWVVLLGMWGLLTYQVLANL